MKRRDFLRGVVPVTALPFLLNGISLRAYGRSPFLETLIGAAAATDRVLVLIQLSGGNDGINTVVPLNQMSAYNNLRGNIAIPQSGVLPLTGATGLHPKMTGFRQLYDQGKLMVVQGVSYPNPNLSHFRATDIWLTAANSNEYLISAIRRTSQSRGRQDQDADGVSDTQHAGGRHARVSDRPCPARGRGSCHRNDILRIRPPGAIQRQLSRTTCPVMQRSF